MKNLISYYYNIVMSEIRKNNDIYILYSGNIEYEFLPVNIDGKELYNIYNILIKNNVYCHEIIYNLNNSFVTYYNYVPYMLIKKNIINKNLIILDDIVKYDVPLLNKSKVNWQKLWEDKIDYYEYQAKEIGIKYKTIRKSFDYYIGMSETAICLFNYLNRDSFDTYISHKRIEIDNTVDDFVNPLNIMLDSRIRDISEYIKINYINNKINISQVFEILTIINLNYDEAILMLSRLLYPSYYFDLYDKIIKEELEESKLNIYIEKSGYYETFLKKIYFFLKKKFNLPEIEWLNY